MKKKLSNKREKDFLQLQVKKHLDQILNHASVWHKLTVITAIIVFVFSLIAIATVGYGKWKEAIVASGISILSGIVTKLFANREKSESKRVDASRDQLVELYKKYQNEDILFTSPKNSLSKPINSPNIIKNSSDI